MNGMHISKMYVMLGNHFLINIVEAWPLVIDQLRSPRFIFQTDSMSATTSGQSVRFCIIQIQKI